MPSARLPAPRRLNIWLNRAFQWGILLLLAWVLYRELGSREQLPALWAAFLQQWRHGPWPWLLLALALLPLNWALEALKWFYFLRRQSDISWVQTCKGVLAGVSFALFTPNRVGEFAGRLVFIPQGRQWQALAANLIGSAAQYWVLLAGGLAGACCFFQQYRPGIPWLAWAPLGWAGLVSGLLLYLYIRRLTPVFKRLTAWKWLRRAAALTPVLEQTGPRDAAAVLLLAALRYAVYSAQYAAILHFCGLNLPVFTLFSGIATIFVVQTVVPLPALAGILWRGNVSVFVWGLAGMNEISALASTFVLWFVNLILPALVGTFFLFNVQITKAFGYED
jgi:hypothetical protein